MRRIGTGNGQVEFLEAQDLPGGVPDQDDRVPGFPAHALRRTLRELPWEGLLFPIVGGLHAGHLFVSSLMASVGSAVSRNPESALSFVTAQTQRLASTWRCGRPRHSRGPQTTGRAGGDHRGQRDRAPSRRSSTWWARRSPSSPRRCAGTVSRTAGIGLLQESRSGCGRPWRCASSG